MLRVIIESPLSGEILRNVRYARQCLRDSLERGEAPFASHLLYAQEGVLDDTNAKERKLGMEAGFAWGEVADMVAMYTDLGISEGMREGIARAESKNLPIEYRRLWK